MKKIAIIGRENVGKSTLFNKLCQKELSIVNNQPGVTRDYVKNIGKLYDLKFELIDELRSVIVAFLLCSSQASSSETSKRILFPGL